MSTAEILLVEDKDSLRQMLRLTLQNAGADFLVLCTNTMHRVAPAGLSTVGLLGTRFRDTAALHAEAAARFALDITRAADS